VKVTVRKLGAKAAAGRRAARPILSRLAPSQGALFDVSATRP